MTQTRADQIDAAFRRFHVDNPHVWTLFERFALQVIARGFENYSADAIFHRIRWHIDIETTDAACKLNNNFTPYYARLFHRRHPEHSGFFRNRVQKSQQKPAVDPDKQFFLSPSTP